MTKNVFALSALMIAFPFTSQALESLAVISSAECIETRTSGSRTESSPFYGVIEISKTAVGVAQIRIVDASTPIALSKTLAVVNQVSLERSGAGAQLAGIKLDSVQLRDRSRERETFTSVKLNAQAIRVVSFSHEEDHNGYNQRDSKHVVSCDFISTMSGGGIESLVAKINSVD